MAAHAIEYGPCPAEDRPRALGLLSRHAPRRDRPGLVADLLADADGGRLDLSGLWVARRRGSIVGAFLTQPLPGRAAGVWPPEVSLALGRAEVADGLVRRALDGLRAGGSRLVQALVDPASPGRGAADLARSGIPRVTDLVYLARETAGPTPWAPTPRRLVWRGFDESIAGEFREVLQSSYAGSLDMPELEGARSTEDVLIGLREGRLEPDHWQIGRCAGEPEAAAIVLLAARPERALWELAYFGLTPPARGRGLGREALARAIDLAGRRVPRLELAFDVRNAPAERLYRLAGFRAFDRRAVHLTILR